MIIEYKIMSEEKKVKPEDDKNAKVYLSQRGVVYNPEDKKFLLGKEIMFSKEMGPWQFPGGWLDVGEETNVGFDRELAEELGPDVTYENKGYIDHTEKSFYSRSEAEGVVTVQLLYYMGGEVQKSDEHDEFAWMTAQEVRDHDECGEWLNVVIEKALLKIEGLEAHDKMIRTLAEFDNYKKRSLEQQKEFTKYASEKVIMDMLPVLDNFHAATGFVPDDQKDSPWLTGIMFIQQQMEKVFEEAGVRAMEISEGDVFDAGKMEAIKSGDDEESGEQKVTKIVQKGYMIGERVMRAARVEIN